ncbi:hypothetical protein LB521_27545 [Mesorhizobium sp. BR-1-1-8]|uniref:hypothetical protein n=1 Tax=Mesorhizobium sp. BR-1-1-8 TaxID=2876659 RepID=UPI001CCF4469|nr:hypothetical protein [Mesorhizobium sp. BR-1-1-8]MBZ9984891.1 hypothetical protein [Mesorhizobium sp. BR-1-1-8]
MESTVTETVKIWGVQTDWPKHNLAKFLDELDHVYHGIPFEFRPTAEIDFEPYYDCAGDSYAQVRVTYERPENPEESAKRMGDERRNWMEQLEAARERVTYCTARLDEAA